MESGLLSENLNFKVIEISEIPTAAEAYQLAYEEKKDLTGGRRLEVHRRSLKAGRSSGRYRYLCVIWGFPQMENPQNG